MPLSAGDKIGPYEIVDLLGKGGMGEVYRAHDTNLSRDVAIKVLPAALGQDPDRLARFEREAKVLAALNHSNIAVIYGLETATSSRAIVMELVEGPTLADRLEKGALPLKESLSIARQIADALEAAHEKGVVHRDLKPANIKVREDGTVKVLDFGLATAVLAGVREPGPGADSPTLTLGATQAGMILGTAAYMAPEQAEGKPVDRRADIWSFGVVLWEMLTGKRLFHADTVPLTLADVLRKELDFTQVPEGTPAPVRDLLKRCLDRDLKNRLPWIGEARIVIQKWLANPVSEADVRRQAKAAPLPSQRAWMAWAVAGLAFVSALGVSFVHFRELPPPAPEPARFHILLPDKGGLAGFPNPTISPNGRLVVFPAVTEGTTRLWVRALDQLEPRPIAGTEGVAGLQFWSPDSRFIAFGVQGTLKKVEASGGPPQSLCSLPGTLLGGIWTGDGRIVFGTLTSSLFRVAAAGGAPSPITTLDPKHQEINHAFPVLLPDGRHFLYSRNTANVETRGIYLGTLPAGAAPEQQPPKRLLADGSSVAFARSLDPRLTGDGHVLFSREGTLMAQPFDSVRLEFSGDAVPIAEQVGGNGDFSVSSTGVLVYATRVGAGGGRHLTWYDRQGKSLGLAGGPGLLNELELAPDGTRVAAVRSTVEGRGASWIDEFARGVSNRITPPDISIRPVWSPDGNRLIFESPPNISHKAASNAGNDEVLFKFERPTDPLDWSHDGRWLLYQETNPQTKHDLMVLPLEQGKPAGKPVVFLQTASDDREGKFSPDGRFVAYLSDESGRFEVYVASFPVPNLRVPISNGGGYQPRWRRDGKELVYFTGDGKLMSVDVTLGGTFKAGVPKLLFQAPIYGGGASQQHRWDMTADGQRFLINTVGGDISAPLTLVQNWAALLRK